MLQSFTLKETTYLNGTIVKIHEDKCCKFGYSCYLKFVGIENGKFYKFCSLYDGLKCFEMSEEDLEEYIDEIIKPYTLDMITIKPKVAPKNIDGIVLAWIWYILIMISSLFFAGIENKILLQMVASGVFLCWRAKKMKGE